MVKRQATGKNKPKSDNYHQQVMVKTLHEIAERKSWVDNHGSASSATLGVPDTDVTSRFTDGVYRGWCLSYEQNNTSVTFGLMNVLYFSPSG